MGEAGNQMGNQLTKMERVLEQAEALVEDMDGFRILDYRGDGVYLTVYPPQGKGKPLEQQELLLELEERKLDGLNLDAVVQAFYHGQGMAVKIAPAQDEFKKDGEVRVQVSSDGMEAILTIYPPMGGEAISFEKAMQALAEAGVTYGVDEALVKQAIDLQKVSEPVVVAKGKPVEEGRDAVIEYNFKPGGPEIKPVELEDGSVDFYNLNIIQNVKAGEILAVKTPATLGITGINVYGKELPAKNGRDRRLIGGKNTRLEDQDNTLIATEAGHVLFLGDKIVVEAVYERKGDVDFSSGNLNFVGSILIRGNVKSGFRVDAGGNVEITGSIEGGIVKAGGHIHVKGGIQGLHTGKVEAGGQVIARFIENAQVVAREDVVAGEAIMHSQVDAGRNIMVGGRKGLIVGGTYRAGEEIMAKIIGSSHGTVTELEVGAKPETRIKLARLYNESQSLQVNLDKATKAINMLKEWERTYGNLPEDKKVLLLKITRAQFQLMKEKEDLNRVKEELELELESTQHGKVRGSGVIHPGVNVTIGRAVYRIMDELPFVCLYQDAGEVKFRPYNA